METGYVFNNSGMRLICICFCSSGNRNVGLFQRDSDGMYITARNTSKDKGGSYSWAWDITSQAERMHMQITKNGY